MGYRYPPSASSLLIILTKQGCVTSPQPPALSMKWGLPGVRWVRLSVCDTCAPENRRGTAPRQLVDMVMEDICVVDLADAQPTFLAASRASPLETTARQK